MGRWLSPDWSAKVEPVPYAKLDFPQSLNLYAFVGNNPVTGVDADGHDSPQEQAQLVQSNMSYLDKTVAKYAAEVDALFMANAIAYLEQQDSGNSTASYYLELRPFGADGAGHISGGPNAADTLGLATADANGRKLSSFDRIEMLFGKKFDGALAHDNDRYSGIKNFHLTIRLRVTPDQLGAMTGAMTERAAAPGQYNVLTEGHSGNCTTSQEDILHAGSMRGIPGHWMISPWGLFLTVAVEHILGIN